MTPTTVGAAPAAPPLVRNRNYQLLWTSQALSEFGYNASMIAFPLLVLALTGSTVASGLVLGTVAAAQLLAGLPAGALADRWSRKSIMLCCEAAQVLAVASLVVALWSGSASVAHMVAVAAVIGVSGALFEPAEDATLAGLVPGEQLATAVAMNSARSSLGQLSGTAAGGFLFAVGRVVPFLVDVVAHAVAFVVLAFIRVPPRQVRPAPMAHLGREIGAGLRWVWSHQHIRFTAICAVVLNLFFSAFYIVVIVLAQQRGVPSGEIGIMAAMLGVGGVLGALVAPYLHRVLSPYVSIVAVFWVVSLLTPLAAFTHDGYLIGGLFAAMAVLAPTANTTIVTQQLLLTPDHLRGRLSGVTGLVVGVAAAVGPVLGGLLMQFASGAAAVLVCAAGIGAVSVLVTVSRTLRAFPRPEFAGSEPPAGGSDAGSAPTDRAADPGAAPDPTPAADIPVAAARSDSTDNEGRQRDG